MQERYHSTMISYLMTLSVRPVDADIIRAARFVISSLQLKPPFIHPTKDDILCAASTMSYREVPTVPGASLADSLGVAAALILLDLQGAL